MNSKEEFLPCKYNDILEIPVKTIEGREYGKLEHLVYGKKLLLIVNVASKSLLADKNYTQLVQLHN
jgi:glutathione peroxidase-family protein